MDVGLRHLHGDRVPATELAANGSTAGAMTSFTTMRRPASRTGEAPDGSDVRVLLGLRGGGMAEFELAAGEVSTAVTHRTVEEIWYVLRGRGEMWRWLRGREEIVTLEPGVCLTIPLGTHFQFRAQGDEPLKVLGITMPPWPGADEAIVVSGPWAPTVPRA
jgi:mannose-6-phosphate isomerase-like protein (cupin superfamily)